MRQVKRVAADGDTTDCYHHFTSDLLIYPSDSGIFEGIYFVEGDININLDLQVGPKGASFISNGGGNRLQEDSVHFSRC